MMKRSFALTFSCIGLLGVSLAASRHLVVAQPPEGGSAKLERPLLTPNSRPALAPPATPTAAVSTSPVAAYPNSFNFQTTTPMFPAGSQVHGLPALRAHTIARAAAMNHEKDAAVQQLLGAYQATKDEAERRKLLADIQAAVTKQFEAKQEVRSKELAALEAKLKELQATHQKRESLKEKIVSDRVQQLINNIDGLGWGYEPNMGNTYVTSGVLPSPAPGFQPFDATGFGGFPTVNENVPAGVPSDVLVAPNAATTVDATAPADRP